MANDVPGTVFGRLFRATLRHDGAGLSDGDLLGCYLAGRDPAAFEALVRRHGPMVLGVCRRLLTEHNDAEDAFQATFLVLVRKAPSVVPPVGGTTAEGKAVSHGRPAAGISSTGTDYSYTVRYTWSGRLSPVTNCNGV